MSRKRRHYQQNSEAGDERPEEDFESYEEDYDDTRDEDQGDAGRSRMAREAKIGLGVIFVLLVVFGGFVYNRMTSADDGAEAAAATTGSGTEANEAAASQKPDAESLAPLWTGAAVSANDGSTETAQNDSPTGPGSWGAVSGAEQTGESGSGISVPSSPPSFPPKLVTVPPAGRYAGYPGMQSADLPAGASPIDQTAKTPSTDNQPHNPLPSASSPTTSDHEQAGMAEAADAAGPDLSRSDGAVPSAPDLRQLSSLDQDAGQPNPLRTETGGAEPTASQPAPRYSWETGYSYQPPPSMRDRAAQASVPTPIPGPPATFQAEPRPSPGTRQDEPLGSSSVQSDSAQQYPGSRVSPPPDAARQWAGNSGVRETDLARPSLTDPPSGLSHLGRQEPLISSSGKEGTYVVQPNDNYWSISRKLYGTDAYFKALAHHNRAKVVNPDRLQLGEEILAPSAAALHETYPDLCPMPAHREAARRRALADGHVPVGEGRVYVVQEGDNLFNIARYELGKATRWTEIVTLNKDQLGTSLSDLNYLTPGMKLLLPDEPPPANIGQRPGSVYPR